MNETFKYTIDKIEKENNVVILNIIPKENAIFDFRPGQFTMLALYDENGEIWQQRPFSICSSPLNKKYIQLAIKVYGKFTNKVATLKKGDTVGISEPNGFFTFNEARMKEAIFLAGGIGITPFMSAIRYVSEKKLPNKITLFYSNKTMQDIVFFEELKSISEKNKNIQVVFALTEEISDVLESEYENKRIDDNMIKKYCPHFSEKYFSLCGPLKFMESLITQLEDDGVPKDYIDMERFK